MLVLSRHVDQSIVINGEIVIKVVAIRGDRVRIGVEADKSIPVHRQEVWEKILRQAASSAERMEKAEGWRSDSPPNEVLVEVDDPDHAGGYIHVMAIYGGDGTRPHWRSEDGDQLWPVGTFLRWRPLQPESSQEGGRDED
jgi:carbon storage regulator